MKVSELKEIINNMIEPLEVKSLITTSGDPLASSLQALRTAPVPEYAGKAILKGGEEITWSFFHDGRDWKFSSSLVEDLS